MKRMIMLFMTMFFCGGLIASDGEGPLPNVTGQTRQAVNGGFFGRVRRLLRRGSRSPQTPTGSAGNPREGTHDPRLPETTPGSDGDGTSLSDLARPLFADLSAVSSREIHLDSDPIEMPETPGGVVLPLAGRERAASFSFSETKKDRERRLSGTFMPHVEATKHGPAESDAVSVTTTGSQGVPTVPSIPSSSSAESVPLPSYDRLENASVEMHFFDDSATSMYELASKNKEATAVTVALMALLADQIQARVRGEKSLSYQALRALYQRIFGKKKPVAAPQLQHEKALAR